MKNRMKICSIVILTLILAFLAGCSSKEVFLDSEPVVLRILAGGPDDSYLRKEWTDYYELTHKNVKFEFIPMYEPQKQVENGDSLNEEESQEERIKRLLTEGTPPDIIFLDIHQLPSLVQEGLLQPMDTYIEKTKFNISQFVPTVIDGIREAGDGKSLYALAPFFNSQALFYNKDLFDEAGVQYPIDGMTWEQVIDLSKQVAIGEGPDQINGIWTASPEVGFHHFLYAYAPPLGLNMINSDTKEMEVNTLEWEKAVTDYLEIAKYFPMQPDMNTNGEWKPEMQHFWEMFQMGKAAMAIMTSSEISRIKDIRMYNPDAPEFEWDVVTFPVHESAPEIGSNIGLNGLMAINRNSQNAELAWDFISYINGEDMMKIRSRDHYQFVTRKDFIPTDIGPSNMEAFYKLKPAQPILTNGLWEDIPNIGMIIDTGHQLFQAGLKGEKTAQQIVEELQEKGQELLDQNQTK